MSGNWKQIIQEKAIEAAVITAFNFVPGLVAKGFTLARNGIEWVFGGRNEAESNWVGKIGGEVVEKADNVLVEYERKELMSGLDLEWVFDGRNEAESDWVGQIREVAEEAEYLLAEYERKRLMSRRVIDSIANKKRRCHRMTFTVAALCEIGEGEESHEFCRTGDPGVVGNESRKRKERGYSNSNSNSTDDLMIMPSGGLEVDPQRFYTYRYGDDGRFTLIYCTTSPQFKWTYSGTDGSGLPSDVVSSNDVVGGVRRLTFKLAHKEFVTSLEAGDGRGRCRFMIVHFLPRPYLLTVDAWADSSSRRWACAFSVLPLPLGFSVLKFLQLPRKFSGRKGGYFFQFRGHKWSLLAYAVNCNMGLGRK